MRKSLRETVVDLSSDSELDVQIALLNDNCAGVLHQEKPDKLNWDESVRTCRIVQRSASNTKTILVDTSETSNVTNS